MNQAQRKFLIDRIEGSVKKQIASIKEAGIPKPPSLENYLYGLALSGKLEIQPTDHIKKVMCDRALNHTTDRYSETWLGTNSGDFLHKGSCKIKVQDLFIIPKEYEKLWEDFRKQEEAQRLQIHQLNIECDTLTTRIQLASDKTLEKMISEIDDMGDISLMDTKLKALIAPDSKQLTQ